MFYNVIIFLWFFVFLIYIFFLVVLADHYVCAKGNQSPLDSIELILYKTGTYCVKQ